MNNAVVIALQHLKGSKLKSAKPPRKPKPRTRQETYLALTEDLGASRFLSCIVGIWEERERRGTLTLERFGRKWIAMSRDEWAARSQLGIGQFKNRARPILEKRCSDFVQIRQMTLKRGEPKQLWVSVDLIAMQAAIVPAHETTPPNKKSVLILPKPKYPYKKAE